jgi:hypothetical protein
MDRWRRSKNSVEAGHLGGFCSMPSSSESSANVAFRKASAACAWVREAQASFSSQEAKQSRVSPVRSADDPCYYSQHDANSNICTTTTTTIAIATTVTIHTWKKMDSECMSRFGMFPASFQHAYSTSYTVRKQLPVAFHFTRKPLAFVFDSEPTEVRTHHQARETGYR